MEHDVATPSVDEKGSKPRKETSRRCTSTLFVRSNVSSRRVLTCHLIHRIGNSSCHSENNESVSTVERMPDENREQTVKQTTSAVRIVHSSKTDEIETTRSRAAPMILRSRATQLESQSLKSIKTEKNRMRLIMENREHADLIEKERKIRSDEEDTSSNDYCSMFCIGGSTTQYYDLSYNTHLYSTPKVTLKSDLDNIHMSKSMSSELPSLNKDAEECEEGAERVLDECRVPKGPMVNVSMESSGLRGAKQRPRDIKLSTPLVSIAAQELESSLDGAAFNPAVAAATTSARCPLMKNSVKTTSSSPVSVSVSATNFRPTLNLGTAIIETSKEDAMEPEAKEVDERRSSTPSPEQIYTRANKPYNEGGSSEDDNRPDTSLKGDKLLSSYRRTWPIRRDVWANQQMGFLPVQRPAATVHNDVVSVMSFSSNSGTALGYSAEIQGDRRLGAKMDVVYNLLGMLGSTEGRENMSVTLFSMSNSIENCLIMRQSGCLPLLIQLIHAPGQDPETRENASQALHNIVHAKSDERAGRREARVLRFLEQLRNYCQTLRTSLETGQVPDDLERHPGPTIAALMKLSFDEAHRHAMCQLGGLHAVAELIEMDHMAHGSECDDQNCITLRRYAGMALTNLTFGDGNNKALLCSFRKFMKALVSQLRSPSDDLRQVTASVLRNLSWKADSSSKQTLREVGAVVGLMKAAMEGRKESTLKSILSALWNLSAHCSTNKVDICAVEGALAFLVDMLSYKAPSKTLAIVENAGGILRNVSSHIAVREDYRSIVRERGCLQVLLQQLRSPSLTVVSNACGALWNLSARCPQDQQLLWDLGAVPMLRSLIHSKHKMISMGSSAALKNLLSARPGCNNLAHLDSTARGLGLPTLPTLVARRQRALEQEIDQNLAETCDNIEPSTSPTNKDDKFSFKVDHSFLDINARALHSYQLHNQLGTPSMKFTGVARSESRDSMRSVTSTHSDTMFERVNRHVLNGLSPSDVQIKQQSSSLHAAVDFDSGMSNEPRSKISSEKKYTLSYKNAIPDHLKSCDFNDLSNLKCMNSTISWSSTPEQESTCSQNLLHSSVEDNLQQSISPKTDSRTDISNKSELNVCMKTKYTNSKSVMDTPSALSFVGSNSGTKDSYGNVYEKTILHQHNSLNTISNTISPTATHRTKGNLFSDYAETDLDQPTDYSLRYAERSLDDEEKQHSHYFPSTEQKLIYDYTAKTYCTEGTPYCSGAASASDSQDNNRQMNSKKLLERNMLQDKNVLKVQTIMQNDTEECQALHFFEEKTKGSNIETDGHSSTEYSVSNSLTTPSSQVFTTNVVDNDDKEESSNSVSALQLDADRKYDTINIAFENNEKFNQNFATNGVNLYISNTLKGSNDSDQVSDGDEDDEDLLTACINIGMQNNRHRHSFIGNNFEKASQNESNLTRYQTSIALDQMELYSSVNCTTNSLDMAKIEPKVIIHSDVCTNEMTESLTNATTALDYSQSRTTFAVEAIEHEISEKHPSEVLQSEIDKVILITTNDNLCELSQRSNLRNSPELQQTIVFNTESNQQQCLSNIDTQSIEDISHLDQNHFPEDTINWENNKPTETLKDKIAEYVSIQQSYTKVTDSESSESINSIEQSEHALLELCIQTGPTKTIDNVQLHNTMKLNTIGDEFGWKRVNDVGENDTLYSNSCEIASAEKEEIGTKQVEKEEVYRRQRDPDAMIASLDRLTATLVQQTEAIRERDSQVMKHSILSDAWNEDSPNEISFPSISISAPIVASFKSDVPEEQGTVTSECVEVSSENGHMTNSKIIQREAIRLAEAVKAEMNRQNELDTISMASMDLEAIKPPSSMGSLLSLTASYAGSGDCSESVVNRDRCNSVSISPLQVKSVSSQDSRGYQNKSLPIGVVAKRALNQTQSHTGSLENLLNECTGSHLENVKPPSILDELPDVGDMENSMLSVASITSEVAELKDQYSHSLTGNDVVFDLLKPVANMVSITCMRYAEAMHNSTNNSLSECLENINPPSLFNEVCKIDESTMDPATETVYSDTLCIDAELHTDEILHPILDKTDEGNNDTDEAITPISSEYCGTSSAESTPRKRHHRNLTPKQKRNLVKERYKTYTIAAELNQKEKGEEQQGNGNEERSKVPRGKCSPLSKLTPKQRRQEDRARFQTQVLKNPVPDMNQEQNVQQETGNTCNLEGIEQSETAASAKSFIPTLFKGSAYNKQPIINNRIEQRKNRETYRTRILNDSECTLVRNLESSVASSTMETRISDTKCNVQSDETKIMLEQNTSAVLNTWNESNKINENENDILLDYESTNLTVNETDSEQNQRMRFLNGVHKKQIDFCDQLIEQDDKKTIEVETSTMKEDVKFPVEIESNSDDESNNTEEQARDTKRPRIIKPGMVRDLSNDSNITTKSDTESPKAVRGRRKALYSTPITRRSTPQSSPLKQVNPVSGIPIGRSNTSPIVRPTRDITLRQNNNHSNVKPKETPRSNTSAKITPNSMDGEKRTKVLSVVTKRASVPQKSSSLTFTKSVKRHSTPPTCSPSNRQQESKAGVFIKPLERQGTFTKDEPEVENAPTVVSTSSSPIKSKIAKPTRGASSKVYPTISKPKISPKLYQTNQSKVMKETISDKTQSSKASPISIASKRLPTGKISTTSKIPTSNQNAAQVENIKIFRKVNSLGSRSNSNCSILSGSSAGTQTRKLAKEATSKVASRWKKVEENKIKQSFEKPDTRQDVQADSYTHNIDAPSPANNPPAFRLFRSSTFEGVPQENDHPKLVMYKSKLKRPLVVGVRPNKGQYRNSCDLSEMNANETLCKVSAKFSESSIYKKSIVEVEDTSVILRRPQYAEFSRADIVDPMKRISRLGSFIRVDSTNGAEGTAQTHPNNTNVRTPASAIIPPFNYTPTRDISTSQVAKIVSDESDVKFKMTDCHSEIVTASTRVTTV